MKVEIGNATLYPDQGGTMKLFAIQAYGNYGAGVAIVRAETKERAIELASKINDRNWQTDYGRPEEVIELYDGGGEGVMHHWEHGE
jgi:hypothetical protein